MRSDTIVAYSYQADIYCPTCIVETMIGQGIASPAARDMSEEAVMDQCAGAMAIDRMDEATFDSGEFPKIVFVDELKTDEHCGSCHEPLL